MVVGGCWSSHQIQTQSEVDVKPIEIKPIHITLDINIKVDRALDDFFGDLDEEAIEIPETDGGSK
ncbi:YnbE family lipoprotein [Victivallis sp. Marseille-Q1083]|uniref:YnbE family lipoprotein n=1 Tax=Victivallis sp. Marseille-Q1083 TaxID=2717288 RepID=UPI0034C5FB1D